MIDKKNINLRVAIGGSTSFDIYPQGWDKTFVINHLSDYEEIIFFGDSCTPDGNDYELYTFLKDTELGASYAVSSPEETICLINEKLLNL